MLREEMKRATKSNDKLTNELQKKYTVSELRSRRVRLHELVEEVSKLEKQLDDGTSTGIISKAGGAPNIAMSLAILGVGTAMMMKKPLRLPALKLESMSKEEPPAPPVDQVAIEEVVDEVEEDKAIEMQVKGENLVVGEDVFVNGDVAGSNCRIGVIEIDEAEP